MGFLEEDFDDNFNIHQPIGCSKCSGGYSGRIGIYEVMPMTTEIGKLVMSGCDVIAITEQARKMKVNSLRRSGLLKVKSGITSFQEVSRVTKD